MNQAKDLVCMSIKLTSALLGFYIKDIISFDVFKNNVEIKLKFIERNIDAIQSIEDKESAILLLNKCKQLLCQSCKNII